MRRSTCLFSFSVALGWLGGFFDLGDAKMDWIYKELRAERAPGTKTKKPEEPNQVPQYFRFNQHLSLTVDFNEHLEPKLYENLQ